MELHQQRHRHTARLFWCTADDEPQLLDTLKGRRLKLRLQSCQLVLPLIALCHLCRVQNMGVCTKSRLNTEAVTYCDCPPPTLTSRYLSLLLVAPCAPSRAWRGTRDRCHPSPAATRRSAGHPWSCGTDGTGSRRRGTCGGVTASNGTRRSVTVSNVRGSRRRDSCRGGRRRWRRGDWRAMGCRVLTPARREAPHTTHH